MSTLSEICRDRTSGAAMLYRRTLELFLRDRRYRSVDSMKRAITRLRDSFPEMAVFAYLDRQLAGTETGDAEAHLTRLLDEAYREPRAIAGHVRRIWRKPRRLVTISQSSVVRQVLADNRDRVDGVVLSEAAPRREGLDMARYAADLGLPVEMTTDAALPGCVRRSDYVLVGADCVTEKYFVNKTGTLPLFLAARAAGARTVVAFEHFKQVSSRLFAFTPQNHSGAEILPRRHKHITVHNRYFESIPINLCDYLVTGTGVERRA